MRDDKGQSSFPNAAGTEGNDVFPSLGNGGHSGHRRFDFLLTTMEVARARG